MVRYRGKLYYTTKEVCARLDISKKTLYNWEKNGLIRPAARDWRNWRLYTPQDIERLSLFIESRHAELQSGEKTQ